MALSEATQRIAGRTAWVGALASVPLGLVHALSRYATADGAEDLELPGVRAWAEPAARLFKPLLNWSDPQTVYLTYGKGWLFILAAATFFAYVFRQRRVDAGQVGGVEKVAWFIALPGYALITIALLGEYWTPWLEETFAFVGIPAMLISVLGSLVLGIGLLVRKARPRTTGWLLVAVLPGFFVISDLIALGAALWPLLFAWGVAGLGFARSSAAVPVAA